MAIARWTDPIVEEVHRTRREILDECENDPAKYRALIERVRANYPYSAEARQTITSEELRRRIKEKYPDVEVGDE